MQNAGRNRLVSAIETPELSPFWIWLEPPDWSGIARLCAGARRCELLRNLEFVSSCNPDAWIDGATGRRGAAVPLPDAAARPPAATRADRVRRQRRPRGGLPGHRRARG